MTDPSDRHLANELRARADKIEANAHREAEDLRAAAAVLLRSVSKPLPSNVTSGKLKADQVDTATRAAIGRHFSNARGSVTPLTAAAHAAGYSLRSLAEKCKVSHSYLSQAAKGDRRVSDSVRERVLALIGWDHWPRTKRA